MLNIVGNAAAKIPYLTNPEHLSLSAALLNSGPDVAASH